MEAIRNKSILVVDDDLRMLHALDRVLAGEGAVVTSARQGQAALDILKRPDTKFDLLITDLRMPATSGLTVLTAVNTIFPRPPVIVLTAFASPFVKTECIRQGAAAFLEKPFDSQVLLNTVSQVLHSGAPR